MQGLPFSPSTGATLGKTVKVTANATPTSVAGSLNCAVLNANTIRVFNNGTVPVFARVSKELQASIAATAADVPVGAGRSVLLANPNPQGLSGLAVLSSTTTACDVFFTPGEGGMVEG